MKSTYLFKNDTGRHQKIEVIGLNSIDERDNVAWDKLAEVTGEPISEKNPGTWYLDDVLEEE